MEHHASLSIESMGLDEDNDFLDWRLEISFEETMRFHLSDVLRQLADQIDTHTIPSAEPEYVN